LRTAPASSIHHGGAAGARPLRGRAGVTLLWSVAGFASSPFCRGFSQPGLSLAALLLLGASDMISVIIAQLWFSSVRRRNAAARHCRRHGFFGTSNEFGQFESGLTAQWLEPCQR